VLGVFTLAATFLLFLEMHETAQIKALAEAQGVSLAAAEARAAADARAVRADADATRQRDVATAARHAADAAAERPKQHNVSCKVHLNNCTW
jgi:hypothetical protein